jgi:hypothetical protein
VFAFADIHFKAAMERVGIEGILAINDAAKNVRVSSLLKF